MSQYKCTYGIDCPNPAIDARGRCLLHDALAMAEEATNLLHKVLADLSLRAQNDRERKES